MCKIERGKSEVRGAVLNLNIYPGMERMFG